MNYFNHISINIPEWLYVVLLLVLCVMAIVIFSRKGVIRIQLRRLLKVMFVEYLVLLFCSTVIFREESAHAGVKYVLFAGYLNRNMHALMDALLNVAIFIPIGFLYCLIDTRKINYKNSQTYYNPRNNEIIKEVHKSYNEPYIHFQYLSYQAYIQK